MGKIRYDYNKLVRNMIPGNIAKKGAQCSFRTLDEASFLHELNRKIVEEAYEFAEANDIEELGDLLEVVSEIMKIKKYTQDDVISAMKRKRESKGDFSQRIYLEYVEEESVNDEEQSELEKDFRGKIPT